MVLTLWCVAVVSLMVILAARVVDEDVESESFRARRFEAREFALTGIAYGRNPKLGDEAGLLHQRRDDGTTLDVFIQSECGRVNINRLLGGKDARPLKELFRLWGADEREASIAVDSLQDWVDKDDLHRSRGAERAQLEGQSDFSIPANRPFKSVEEMAGVRGMDVIARLRPDWAGSFSVHSGAQIDLQGVSVDLLRIFGGVSSSQAEEFVRARNGRDGIAGTADDLKVGSVDEVVSRFGLSEVQAEIFKGNFGVGLEPTRIESIAQIGGVKSQIAVVTIRGQGDTDLSWEER